ncbi:MAG: hypothetical protein ACK5NX_03885 [Armatimonadota bacterium]|jgi:hypothetical protein
MENTENNPTSADALLAAARDAAGIAASLTGSEAISAFIGSVVADNDFIQTSIGTPEKLSFEYLDDVIAQWQNSPFADVYLIDTRNGATLSLSEFKSTRFLVCYTSSKEIEGQTVTTTTFPSCVDETNICREDHGFNEIEDLEINLDRYLQSDDVVVPERETSTGWERFIFFIGVVKVQLELLEELCPNGVTPTDDDDDEWNEDEESYDEEYCGPWDERDVVGWGEDVEWRFGINADELAELTEGGRLIDPQSTAENIKWIYINSGMSRPDVLDVLGGCAERDGSVSRMFNDGVIMKYTYNGWLGERLPIVDDPGTDIEAILSNFVSAWQASHFEQANETWFSLSDASDCLYGQAQLVKAHLLREQKDNIEETPESERSEAEIEELAGIPALIEEHEAEAASCLKSYRPEYAP